LADHGEKFALATFYPKGFKTHLEHAIRVPNSIAESPIRYHCGLIRAGETARCHSSNKKPRATGLLDLANQWM
jgi:hypothetical protein